MSEPFANLPDFWRDVIANLVAFGIGIVAVVVVELAIGRRVRALH